MADPFARLGADADPRAWEAADEPAARAAVAEHIGRVQGVLISTTLCRAPWSLQDAFKTMRVPVVELVRSNANALRSMVEMLRHPDA